MFTKFPLFCVLFSITSVYSIDVYHMSTIESSVTGFGSSVAMNEHTLVVGSVGRYSNTGNYADVYQIKNETWDFTNSVQLEQNGWFGYSIALNDQYCAIGGYAADKIYVYKENEYYQTIKNTNTHEFGKSVAISDQYMIVGAPSGTNYAYIYQQQDDKYILVKSITEYTSESQFGISVDITDEYALVGSNTKAFLFAKDNNGWNTILEIDGYTDQTNFGNKVALTNDYAVVTAYGAAKIFIFGKTHNVWNKEPLTIIDQYTNENEFGYSISVHNHMLLTSARGAKTAYLFADFAHNISDVVVINEFDDQLGFGYDVVLTDTHMAITSKNLRKVYVFGFDYDVPMSIPSSQPSGSPTSIPTSQPSGSPTSIPSSQPSGSPTSRPTYGISDNVITPTSSPTEQTEIVSRANTQITRDYLYILGVLIAVFTAIIMAMFYIIQQCKKYNKIHVESQLDGSVTFTSIYDLEKEGWTKTIHPMHVEYDSDEESQVIAPIHQKYRQTIHLPV